MSHNVVNTTESVDAPTHTAEISLLICPGIENTDRASALNYYQYRNHIEPISCRFSLSSGDIDSFIDDDSSAGQRKSRMLVAGLAGLDKIGEGALDQYDGRLGVNITAESRWTRMID